MDKEAKAGSSLKIAFYFVGYFDYPVQPDNLQKNHLTLDDCLQHFEKRIRNCQRILYAKEDRKFFSFQYIVFAFQEISKSCMYYYVISQILFLVANFSFCKIGSIATIVLCIFICLYCCCNNRSWKSYIVLELLLMLYPCAYFVHLAKKIQVSLTLWQNTFSKCVILYRSK